jgi:hypothetical protein
MGQWDVGNYEFNNSKKTHREMQREVRKKRESKKRKKEHFYDSFQVSFHFHLHQLLLNKFYSTPFKSTAIYILSY